MGAGYKVPTIHDLHGSLLNKWVDETKKNIEKYCEIWKTTGCTLMADRWSDGVKRTLVNFLVYCPIRTFFIKFVDAYGASKTGELI